MLTASEAIQPSPLHYLLVLGLFPSRNAQLETLLLQSQTELQKCKEVAQLSIFSTSPVLCITSPALCMSPPLSWLCPQQHQRAVCPLEARERLPPNAPPQGVAGEREVDA